jgi:hypothetical protein
MKKRYFVPISVALMFVSFTVSTAFFRSCRAPSLEQHRL